MKKILVTLITMVASVVSFAQTAENTPMLISETPTATDTVKVSHFKKHYNRFSFSYSQISLGDVCGSDMKAGMNLTYLHGIKISKALPMYIEFGADARYYCRHYNVLSVDIPVNFTYYFTFDIPEFAVAPFAGLHVTGNIIHETVKRTNLNEIQAGAQIGLGITYKKLWVGMSYAHDFNNYSNLGHTDYFNVGVGIQF